MDFGDGIKLALWILVIYLVWSVYSKGYDDTKDSVQSVIDKVKDIVDRGKDNPEDSQEQQEEQQEEPTIEDELDMTYIGKPSCVDNEDCNSIPECNSNCTCIGGGCWI